MKKRVDHIIKDSFESNNLEKAPENIWGAIGNELDQSEVDSAVKNAFEMQSNKAPEAVWNNIQDQLDIDRVWIRISDHIFIKQRVSITQVAAMLLLLFVPFMLDRDPLFPFIDAGQKASVQQESVQGRNNEITQVSSIENLAVNQNASAVRTVNSIATNSHNSHNPESLTSGNSNAIVEENTNNLNDVKLSLLGLASIQESSKNSERLSFIPKPFNQRKLLGLTAGTVVALEQTRLMNNEARIGARKGSLIENKARLGASYGINLDYRFSSKYSLTGEYLIQSQINEAHNFYNKEGVYSEKEREVNLYRIGLMLSRHSRTRHHGVFHSSVGRIGGYVAGVKSDYTRVNGVITEVNSIYKRTDLGLRVEFAEQMYYRRLSIEAGLRANIGLFNMASQEGKIPPHLNYTQAISYGGHIRIGYSF